ncbi:MAG: SpoIIE family protein phosphatase [Ignavibacteriae bacterium]|nr:SpoIIE family protein phosphatase [Ignavibacteriota bacterium]
MTHETTWIVEGAPRGTALTRFWNARPALARSVYVAALVLAVAYSAFHLIRYASITTDENVYVDSPDGLLIVSIVPGGVSDKAGLQVGDIIVEVNGNPVRTAGEAMVYIVSGSKGKRLEYVVRRDGRTIPISVVLADYGITLFTLSLILTGVAFLALGAFVSLRRPESPLARLFGWGMLLTGLFLVVNFHYPIWYYVSFLDAINPYIMMLSYGFGVSVMYHLFLLFPAPRRLGMPPRWFMLMLYGVPAFVALLVLLRLLPTKPLPMIVSVFLLLGTSELLIRRVFRLPANPAYEPLAGQVQIAGILAGLTCFGWIFVRESSLWQAVFFLQLAVPLLLLLTIIRHRLFDLYIIIRRASLYRVATAAWNSGIAVAGVAMVLILSTTAWDLPVLRFSGTSVQVVQHRSFPPEERETIEKRVMLIVALALVGGLWRLHRSGARFIDQKFHRGDYDYREALNKFSQLSTQFSDVPSLAAAVVRDLPALMHLSGAAFALRMNGAYTIHACEGLRLDLDGAPALPSNAVWITELAGTDAVDNIGARAALGEAGVEFVTPVILDKRIEALILLGEKLSGMNFSKDDVELLDSLAINVADALLTMSFYEHAKEQARLRRELEIARRIQLSTLPAELPEFPGIEVAAVSSPATEVGGDFYDYLGHHDAITFLVGDVSGKGTSAALYLSRIQGIVRAIDSYGPSLHELFVRLNGQMFDHIERQAYVTMAALRLDLIRGNVSYLRAGHLPLLHYRASDGAVLQHRPKGIGIGLDSSMFGDNLELETFPMEGDDVFLLVSDGITEATHVSGEQYGLDRLVTAFRAACAFPAEGIKAAILEDVARFAGSAEQHDDMTVLVVKLR